MTFARLAGPALVAGLIATIATASAADEASTLFNNGTVPGVSATAGGLDLAGSRLACASCHGRDGRGRAEGDALAPSIVRGLGGLDRAGVSPSGTIRPAYTPDTFRPALVDGITPDGRDLSPRMPRYRISNGPVQKLWAYLETLPTEQRRGVDATGLTFAIPAPASLASQAGQLRAIMQEKADALAGKRMRLRFTTETVNPSGLPDAPCPGAQAVALVLAFIDPERRILEKARQCGVPALFPLADLVGHENPLDVRADRAPLLAQWKALLSAAGPQSTILLPPDLRDWERDALDFANIRAREGTASVLVLPFGLNRSDPDRAPADVFAPAYGSAASLAQWKAKGHRLHLAVTTAPDVPTSIEAVAATLATILDRAAELAGPDVTRASFMETVGRIGAEPSMPGTEGSGLNYSAHRLTGRIDMRIERY